MLFKGLAASAALSLLAAKAQAQHVIAHFIAGNAQPADFDWAGNIMQASGLGIEAFAFNVVQDSFDSGLVDKAYEAVGAAGNFGIFLQFDFDQSDWDMSQVGDYITKYGAMPGQFKVNDKILVSTFEGGARASEWQGVIDTSTMLFAPDWTNDKGSNPGEFAADYVGGALSWDVWPHGTTMVSEDIDTSWEQIIGSDKTYIMGVAPWFYTNLAQYNKNWVARGSGLWHTRWTQVMDINPPIVEILTWNDFGESHYIGPNTCIECMPGNGGEIPNTSVPYVQNNPHDGFAALVPAYIDAYKSQNQSTTQLDEKLVFAHTTNPVTPAGGCATDGSTALYGGAGGDAVAVDAIDVYVVLNTPATISVKVGGTDLTPTPLQASLRGVNYFAVPLNGANGEVEYTITRDGNAFITHTESPGISTDCSGYGGMINYNAVTGVVEPGSS